MKTHSYEEDLDILYIYNNPENEKVSNNLVLGNLVLDIAENGKVLGVEIDCASKLFKTPSENLNNLKNASVEVIKFGNMVALGFILSTALKEYSFQFAFPTQKSQITSFC
jgi:uncharacterized protein YuzE